MYIHIHVLNVFSFFSFTVNFTIKIVLSFPIRISYERVCTFIKKGVHAIRTFKIYFLSKKPFFKAHKMNFLSYFQF